ncbi:hypothetical protein CLOSTASPAR_04155 [[Clostridium] asparagiforme DSM 15981]|uniref:Uncharacterized protein n=1 Tax=[Clostridium] asparagiforme DSM 15981 TaxID=518636 RepID=C0D4G1_9FIRM|nr:hypothetical protein CLOSTASPAR_04155 [[Clostridium] asparagiforme DSM 15981]
MIIAAFGAIINEAPAKRKNGQQNRKKGLLVPVDFCTIMTISKNGSTI